MRVNISYSAELDDVPAELSRIIVDTANRLEATAAALTQVESLLTATTAVDNAQRVADLVNAARGSVAKVDTRLNESIAILGGYYQAKTDPDSLVSDATDEATDALIEQAEELSEQLSESREELEHLIAETSNGVTQSTEVVSAEEQ